MFRAGGSSSRQLLRQTTSSSTLARSRTAVVTRAAAGGVRYQSTAVPRRSVKNGLARWAIAIGGTYWYMTSPIFNDEPAYVIQDNKDSEPQLQSIQSVKPARNFTPPHPADAPVVPSTPTSNSPPSINPKSDDPPPSNNPLPTSSTSDKAEVDPEHALALEQEASQQGAFNEETGEINWDCPCLGGMAHGPCGEQFRDAFSCFVYSTAEPKGMDCVDKFERMQLCFREHPEIYAEEIADDERIAEEVKVGGGSGAGDEAATPAAAKNGPDVDQPSVWTPLVNEQQQQQQQSQQEQKEQQPKEQKQEKTQAPALTKEQPRDYSDLKSSSSGASSGQQLEVQRTDDKLRSESSEIVPKAAHDATK